MVIELEMKNSNIPSPTIVDVWIAAKLTTRMRRVRFLVDVSSPVASSMSQVSISFYTKQPKDVVSTQPYKAG